MSPGGRLFVVATPMGDFDDITLRALQTLRSVDLILCEDTRKTGLLLKHHQIDARLKSYRIHRLEADEEFALQRLRNGEQLALVSDAGTPGLSDPGSSLVRKARAAGVEVRPIPGPSALAAVLSVCGWQTNPSHFTGFLSPKPGRRRKALLQLATLEALIVVYESVHRVERLLRDIRELLPARDILIARELSKTHEEILLWPAGWSEAEFAQAMAELTKKGEFTVVLGPP